MHLYVIRHGQSFVNLPDWDGLDPDTLLTPTGEQQAKALASWLPDHLKHIDVIYSSNMRRAKSTAEAVAGAYNMEIILDHRLREIGNNRIDHTPYPEGEAPGQADWIAYVPAERPFSRVATTKGSESIMHFRIRVASFIEEVVEKHPGQTVVAVCHGGVMEAVFDYCFGIGPWRHCEVNTFNTGVSHFEYVAIQGRETWRLYSHNSIEHLNVASAKLTF